MFFKFLGRHVSKHSSITKVVDDILSRVSTAIRKPGKAKWPQNDLTRTIIAVRFLVPPEFQNHRKQLQFRKLQNQTTKQSAQVTFGWSESVINKAKTNNIKSLKICSFRLKSYLQHFTCTIYTADYIIKDGLREN